MRLTHILNQAARREIDLSTKLKLIDRLDKENIEISRAVFEDHGMDTSPTNYDGVMRFLDRHKDFKKLPSNGEYHEIMHSTARGTASTLRDEARIGIYEYVFYGGFYDERCFDEDILDGVYETPKFAFAMDKAAFRFQVTFKKAWDKAIEDGTPPPTEKMLSLQEQADTFIEACQKRLTFVTATNGWNPNHMELRRLLARPQVFMGVVEDKEAEKYTTVSIPKKKMQAILSDLQAAHSLENSFDGNQYRFQKTLDSFDSMVL